MPIMSLAESASQYTVKEKIVATTTATKQFVEFNPNRVALAFCDASGNTYTGTNPATVTNFFGNRLNPNANGFFLNYADWGPAVQSAWYAANQAGNSNLWVLEVIYTPTGGG